uniref:Nipped-B protein n=1 Tax=Sander lucioperca TaxID=283035 RepID=A0A8D0D6G7_SANLU
MNGDMPHVPITTLAGIASLTDLLNQLPLPSPLPATTAKSLLYNGRISEEVSSLLVCRDENLVTQLAHSLNQVSTEHIELKDNLGNDEPEGDMPMLLQTLLSRNPKIFRDKSMPTQYKVWGGKEEPMMQQYKVSQNQVHGSPGSNYQQTTVPQSPPGCFTSPQSGSGARFVQNSPIPSPYTPQSPADYMQYNPPSYSQHQQTQQGKYKVRSRKMFRNIHDNKVSGQLSSTSSNHNARLGSDEDYINMAHRLGNEENNPSMRVATFPVKSPQSVCSPAGSEETAKTGSRPPLIMQSPPLDVPPGAAPDRLLTSADRKKKQKERTKEEAEQMDTNASYDIVSSPSKESARLTLKLSRVKFSDMDQSAELPLRPRVDSDHETDLMNNSNQLSRTVQDLSHTIGAVEQANCQQVPVRPNTKESADVSGVVFDDAEIDTLAEIERIERESASERERWSKEVQDKDKPLKKRKQDSYPQESGAESSDGPTVQGGNTDSKLTHRKTNATSNGASRPALMVSIDLQQAGRIIGQPVVVLEAQKLCEDHLRQLKSKTDGKVDKVVANRPGIINQHADSPRKSGSDGQPETPKQKQESRRESKHRHDSKTVSGKGHSVDRRPDAPRQKHDKHSDLSHKEEKNHNSHRSNVSQPETPKTMSKAERNSKHGEDKVRDRDRAKDKDRERDKDRDKDKDRERMDSSTFKRFTASMDSIIESLEDVDLTATDEDEIPEELLLGKHQLSELGSDSAKIKAMGIFHKFPSNKLVKMLNILEKNIQDSVKLSTLMNHDNDSMDEERLWRDLIMERVAKSADACLTALNIMTSPRMPKAVYIEDVIERVLQYTKFHLQNSLYPHYDPVYRVGQHSGMHTSKSKRAKSSTHKQKVVVMLYNKVCDIVSNISELLEIQLLTDTTILQVSTLGITPFFVENVSELQLCAITLVTAVFSRYEKHRQLILEEIFTSLARLPTSKRSLRNFRLNSTDSDGEPLYIQMVTALVLQLIQCVVHLPSERDAEDEHNKKMDKDVFITNTYETAMRTAQNFLSVFLKKCGSKQGEEDYRPLFEKFVHDLLSTVNRPEWPAAELLLSLLGRLLVHQFSNKQTEMALRVASLDYLGTVASRLRKDAVTSKMDQKAIDRILKETEGSDEIQQLQKALLDFLNENIETDPSLVFSRKFYIAQWFRDTISEAEKAMKSQNDDEDLKGRHHSMDIDSTEEIMQRAETRKKFLRKVMKTSPSHFSSLGINSNTVDYEDSCLIVRYLASMRPFAQSFDIYLSQILRVLGESAIAVRTKAMKCLSEVVAVDPSILARVDMQRGVHCRLMDNSTSVREAAVELLGRFVLSRPELIEQYYDMLIERILDTGISVRKRVIKILRDICLEQPDFHKVTEMCVRMIRRVNDEEGIKKLVNETFQKIWFTPTPSHDKNAMTRKILNITDVVLACKDTGYDWFEQLLQNLLKSEEQASYKPAKKACVQLVDNLVEHILKYEESLADCEDKGDNSGRLVACITTLYLFSKIRAQLMVKHAMTMQPYLTTKCNTQNDFMVICNVAKILELVVPLMEHPSETFLTTIEEDLMKLIIKYGMTVVQHCVSCLGAVVNKVTHNYKFVWACFNRYYGALAKLKTQHQEDPNSSTLVTNKPTLLRSLFTVGALCRHFDFDQEEFKGSNKVNTSNLLKQYKVLELLLYFTTHNDEEVQIKAIIGLGFQFIMHPELMFVQDVKVLYNNTLSDENSSVSLKIQVLKNLQTYLQEEDSRMQEADREWKNQSNQGLVHPVQCVPYLIAMGTDPEPTMKNKADQQLAEIDKKYSGFIHMKAVAGLKMSYQVQQAINGSKGAVIRGFRHDDSDAALCSHLYTLVRGNRQHRRAFLISLLNLFDDSSKTEVNMLLFIADNLACFPYQTQEEPLFIMHHIDITLSVSGSNLLQSFKEVRNFLQRRKHSSDEDDEDEDDEQSMVHRRKKPAACDSDGDMEDEDAVMDRLPENSIPLLDFASSSQGILLLLVLKQHLKNLYGFSDSKIQKYSPTESAKVYDKAVNRKSKVHFNPRQTLNYLKSDLANTDLSHDTKRNIVKQYLDFKVLMEHLDRDEEDEEGEASANARNKAITSLLKVPKSLNHNHNNHTAPVETEEEESEDEEPPSGGCGLIRKRRENESAEDTGHLNERVKAMDVIAICCPKYKDRPQIARVIQRIKTGYSIHWMTGSYSGPWAEVKKRDGRKKVPWVDTIKESDIIYKKISLTSGHKLTNKVAQTLRALYAAKDGD